MRLRDDYNHICFVHRLKLRNPIIEVTELGRLWGQWDPESHTIRMSLNLIENYPWDMVLEILRHEMAHQIVTDQFGSDEAHGPLFRRHFADLDLRFSPGLGRSDRELAVFWLFIVPGETRRGETKEEDAEQNWDGGFHIGNTRPRWHPFPLFFPAPRHPPTKVV